MNDPLSEAGTPIPLPENAEPDCRDILVVEKGYISIAWSDRLVEESDWDEIERNALAII